MTATNLSGSATTGSHWLEADDAELERRWADFLKGKRQTFGEKEPPATYSRPIETRDEVQEFSTVRDASTEDRSSASMRRVSFARDEAETSTHSRASATKQDPKGDIDMFKMFEMFKLFDRRNWGGLTKHILHHPQAATVHLKRSSKGLVMTATGNMLLHEVCRCEPSAELIDALLIANKKAVELKGEKGYLPLHFACAHTASAEVVKRLLVAFPAAAESRDDNDLMLPLHLAVKWRSSEEVMKTLNQAFPEARKLRDIYAKIPQDYAYEIVNDEDHNAVMAALTNNSSDMDESLRSNEAEGQVIAEELMKSRLTVSNLSAEISTREKQVHDLMDHHTVQLREMEEEKQNYRKHSEYSKSIQDTQAKKLALLQAEHEQVKSLHQTTEQKRVLLTKKIEVLIKANEVKQDLIQRLEHESNVKSKGEISSALRAQEQQYKDLLEAERARVATLEKRAKEVEITHRLYTKAILEEHDREATDFESYTMQFKDLEANLRKQVDTANEKADNLEVEFINKETRFQEILKEEHAKVGFLEEHVTKVNILLETEQTRFQDLETILKQTIDSEDGDRDELVAEFAEREKKYQSLLDAEKQKVSALDEDYAEVRELLKTESEKVQAFELYENELKKLIEAEQLKSKKLEVAHQEYKKLLESGKKQIYTLEQSESEAKAQLRAEQQKVQRLESNQKEIKKLLAVEEQKVKDLQAALEKKTKACVTEMEKVAVVKSAQKEREIGLEAMENKVRSLQVDFEEKVASTHKQRSQSDMAQEEIEAMTVSLQAEKKKVYDLVKAQQELTAALQSEKTKVLALEEAQVVKEAELELTKRESNISSDQQLHDSQKLLQGERSRVSSLEKKHELLSKKLESDLTEMNSLKQSLNEKTALLDAEMKKVARLEEEQETAHSKLMREQNIVGTLKAEKNELQKKLEASEEHVKSLQLELEEARTCVEIKEVKVRTLEREEYESSKLTDETRMELAVLKNAYDIEEAKVHELTSTLTKHEAQLEAEQELVHELELELQETRALFEAEKQRTAEGMNSNAQNLAEQLRSERTRVDSLEQGHLKKDVMLDTESNKVRAMEGARDQIQNLLEWEQKNLRIRIEKQAVLESKLQKAQDAVTHKMTALQEKELNVESLTRRLEHFDEIKQQVVKLNSEAKQRDLMLASVLHAIGEDNQVINEEPVEQARVYVEDLQTIIGLDLAGLESSSIEADECGGALVTAPSGEMTKFGKVSRALCWTIPLIPVVAVAHDPSLLDDITAGLDPQVLKGIAAQYPGMLKEMMGNIHVDPAMLRTAVQEPFMHMFGMAQSFATRGPRTSMR